MAAPIIHDFEMLRCAGRGSYGEVWLARSVMGTYRAVKIVYRRNFENDRPYEREFNGIKRFEPISRSHPSLMNIFHVGRNDEEGYFYYVMELADDEDGTGEIDPGSYEPKTLRTICSVGKPLPFDTTLNFSLSLAAAVSALHQHELIHRDIKPANIIFVNGSPKLADIGLVTDVGANTIPGGTLGYIAPEAVPSPPADVYSLGKVIYEMATGKDRHDFPDLPTYWNEHPDLAKLGELNEIIIKACAANPRERYQTAEELHADLVLLRAGESIKHLRSLERRYVLLARAAIAVLILLLIGGFSSYQIYRGKRAATHRLATSYVSLGVQSLEQGDLFGSLPWFAEALGLERNDAERLLHHRVRMGVLLPQLPTLTRLWIHGRSVNEVHFSHDGRWLVAAESDGSATVWDVAQDQKLFRLDGHSRETMAAVFSPDNRWVATASLDNTVLLWSMADGSRRYALSHPQSVYCVRFDGTSQRLVTACGDGMVRIWNAQTGDLEKSWRCQKDGITRAAAFHPEGEIIATAGTDRQIRLWNVETEKMIGKPLLHGSWIYGVSFNRDGSRILSASFDKTARIWDSASGHELFVFEHDAAVRSAEFSPDEQYIVTSCWDFTTRVWSLESSKLAGPPFSHSAICLYAAFGPNSVSLATATTHGVVSVWDLTPKSLQAPAATNSFTGDGQYYFQTNNQALRFFSAGSGQLVAAPVPLPSPCTGVTLNRTARHCALFGSSGTTGVTVQVRSIGSTAAPASTFVCGKYNDAVLSEDGSRLVTISGATLNVWNPSKGLLVTSIHTRESIDQIRLHDAGRLVAVVTDQTVQLRGLEPPRLIAELTHPAPVTHVAFSPDGTLLVSACADGDLTEMDARLWDTRTGHQVGESMHHRDGVLWAEFSPNGKKLVTASEDYTGQLWEVPSGRRATPPLRHRFKVYEACFSPDGRWVATVSQDSARVWNAATGEAIIPPLKLKMANSMRSVQFIDGGRQLITISGKQMRETRIWDLRPDNRPTDDLLQLAQLLSGYRIDEVGGTSPLTKDALRERWERLRRAYPATFTRASSPAPPAQGLTQKLP